MLPRTKEADALWIRISEGTISYPLSKEVFLTLSKRALDILNLRTQ
jgi:hypothetical protein